jgi:hypothetical protein
MTAEKQSSSDFIDELIELLDVGDRQVVIRHGGLGRFNSVYVTLINLPYGAGGAGGGAEAENNRLSISVTGFGAATGKVKAETSVSHIYRGGSIARENRIEMRAKTAEPAKIAQYVADFLNKVAREEASNFTHTKGQTMKSNSSLLNAIWELSLDGGPDEESGSSSEPPFLWVGIMRNGAELAKAIEDSGNYHSRDQGELEDLRRSAGVIITEDSQGFHEYHSFDTKAELEKAWEEAVEETTIDDEEAEFDPNRGVYYVWVIGGNNQPLDEGPFGPHDLEGAKTFARISATKGAHDRAVSRGVDPKASSFEIVRRYRAGSGERVL